VEYLSRLHQPECRDALQLALPARRRLKGTTQSRNKKAMTLSVMAFCFPDSAITFLHPANLIF
jgi:hypothetical protein